MQLPDRNLTRGTEREPDTGDGARAGHWMSRAEPAVDIGRMDLQRRNHSAVSSVIRQVSTARPPMPAATWNLGCSRPVLAGESLRWPEVSLAGGAGSLPAHASQRSASVAKRQPQYRRPRRQLRPTGRPRRAGNGSRADAGSTCVHQRCANATHGRVLADRDHERLAVVGESGVVYLLEGIPERDSLRRGESIAAPSRHRDHAFEGAQPHAPAERARSDRLAVVAGNDERCAPVGEDRGGSNAKRDGRRKGGQRSTIAGCRTTSGCRREA